MSDEAARAEGVRLGMLFWGPNGGPIAPIDAPYPGKAFTGSIQDRHDVVTYYEDGKPFTGAKHRRSGSEWYVEGKRVA
ncbi:hypothetical protein [uncultured Methylobacterium sp.]|uniref:hypothetical protein n=1 Tax=uncultured Methylobacterium sp. TaxID=157278 RepID=UPI002620AB30|nr:hypothetical protein [uncultured Methylobacterium sp.]